MNLRKGIVSAKKVKKTLLLTNLKHQWTVFIQLQSRFAKIIPLFCIKIFYRFSLSKEKFSEFVSLKKFIQVI